MISGRTKASTRTTKPASNGDRLAFGLRTRRFWSDDDWPARNSRGWRKHANSVQASKKMVMDRKTMARMREASTLDAIRQKAGQWRFG